LMLLPLARRTRNKLAAHAPGGQPPAPATFERDRLARRLGDRRPRLQGNRRHRPERDRADV